MSHYMTALAMKQTGLKPAAKIVLYWLADHHNETTGACFPSLNTLAKECEMNRTTVVRHLDDLERNGLIQRTHRVRENGSQTSTEYYLNLSPVAKHNSPCCKTQQPPVAKCDPHNLGNNNLGNEQIEDTNVSLQVAPANDISSAVSRYNDAAAKAGWPQVQKMTPNRSKQLRARLKECDGMDGWEIALRKAFDSDFCRGRTSKPWGGFGFDWLVKAANFTKLMEGNYDNRHDTARAGDGISGGRENRSDPALEQISRLAGLR